MADIAPFRGVHYASKAGQLERLVAPPYDVISPGEQQRLYGLSPYNVVRLTLNADEPDDDEEDNRYTRAAQHLDEWLADGILAHDPTPAVYVYDQEFQWGGRRHQRRGILSIVKIEELGRGSILPHENTMKGPKADRLKLMSACRGCLSPVFAIYPDEDEGVSSKLGQLVDEELASGRAPSEVVSPDGLNRLLPLTDPEAIEGLRALMCPKSLFIADGHHRYETTWAYRSQQIQEHGRAGLADYVLMMSVSMSDPGLLILPTHRVVRNVDSLSIERLASLAQDFFRVKKLSADVAATASEHIGRHHLLAYFGREDGCLSLRLRDDKVQALPGSDLNDTWRQLDVNLLRNLIFGQILGLDVDAFAQSSDISYVHESQEAIRLVDDESWDAAFLLEPTHMDELECVATAGERMPPKSTYFWPKLLSGLAFYLFRE